MKVRIGIALSTATLALALPLAPAQAATSAPAAPAASTTVAVATAPAPAPAQTLVASKGDWCGPGHGNRKSWWVPDHFGKADFSASCKAHDFCYSSNNHVFSRKTCDVLLRSHMKTDCREAYGAGLRRTACYGVANTYYLAVRKFAKKNYHGTLSNA